MKSTTYATTEKMYQNEDGTLDYFQFDGPYISGGVVCNNFQVVKKMAADGFSPAISALNKLENMTSRERSESGIYWKMQQTGEWVAAKSALTGQIPRKAVIVQGTSIVSRNSVSRARHFRHMMLRYSRTAAGSYTEKIPYCNEHMTITISIAS